MEGGGLSEISVVDNGHGIEDEFRSSLGQRVHKLSPLSLSLSLFINLFLPFPPPQHYTSKLREYEDLEELTSFGFRGEAINSLCSAGKVFL